MSHLESIILQLVGLFLLTLLSICMGYGFGKIKSKAWAIGYILPLGLLILLAIGHRYPPIEVTPPFSWLMEGRREFILFIVAITLIISLLLPKLKHFFEKFIIVTLWFIFIAYFSAPFWFPITLIPYYKNLKTSIDADGVCLQQNKFDCGPATAVTILYRLGINADEGKLAMNSFTTPITGTPPDQLATVLNEHYKNDNLTFKYRFLKSIDELKPVGLCFALLRYSFWAKHYVAILNITDKTITIGDSLVGKSTLSYDEFNALWERSIISVQKDGNYINGEHFHFPPLKHTEVDMTPLPVPQK